MTDATKGAWFGDPALKAEVLARMVKHREEDEIIQGFYQDVSPETASGYKGCLIGCTLPKQRKSSRGEFMVSPADGWHGEVERLYGIPREVASMLDDTFESQDTFEGAAEFAVASIEAIPVGADLSAIATWYWQDKDWMATAAEVLEQLRNAPLVGGGHA